MKDQKNEVGFFDKIDDLKKKIENKTLQIGKYKISLTSALIYLACLVCALFIWLGVAERNTEIISRRFDNVSIVLEGESALAKNDMAVFDFADTNISVTVEGAKNKVESIKEEDIVAYVDVSEIEESGNVRAAIKVRGAGKLDTITYPTSLKLFVDEIEEKDIPVNVVPVSLEITNGLAVDIIPNIESVTVSGAKSVLEGVIEARAEISVGKVDTSITATAPITLVDASGNEVDMEYLTLGAKTVLVAVNVSAEKTVPLEVTYKYGYINNRNIKVTLNPSSVKIKGDPQVLKNIESIKLPEIDETTISDDVHKVTMPILPSGVSLVDKNIQFSADLALLKTKSGTVSISSKNITVVNPKGYTYELPDAIDVAYIVDSASSAKVKSDSFSVKIDLTGIAASEGISYKVLPEITVNTSGFTLYPVNIEQIDIVLSEDSE